MLLQLQKMFYNIDYRLKNMFSKNRECCKLELLLFKFQKPSVRAWPGLTIFSREEFCKSLLQLSASSSMSRMSDKPFAAAFEITLKTFSAEVFESNVSRDLPNGMRSKKQKKVFGIFIFGQFLILSFEDKISIRTD